MSAELTTAADRTVYSGGERPVHALVDDLLASSAVNEATVEVDGAGDEGGFLPAGERELRPYGSSTGFTFTRPSLDVSGFAEDESVTAFAKPGAILLVSNAAEGDGVDETVRVTLGVANVPEDVAETLDEYGASVVPASVEVTAQGTLAFAVSLPSEFDEVAERDVRPFGDSTSFTLPPDSLDIAGLGEGDGVDVYAAEGAVLIVGVTA